MYNQYADEQINTFERRQREQRAAMHRMAKGIELDRPTIWAPLRSILHGALARISTPTMFGETPAARKRS